MAQGHKKVVVRQFDAGPVWGYLAPWGFVQAGQVPLLLPDGRANSIPLSQIKLIAYVRDFNLDDPLEPERMGRRAFRGRPRGEGLWLRVGFRDGDSLEGLASFDLALLDMLVDDHGLSMTPPDGRGNTNRVFVPRGAVQTVEVLAAITSPSRRAAAERAKASAEDAQPNLFEG